MPDVPLMSPPGVWEAGDRTSNWEISGPPAPPPEPQPPRINKPFYFLAHLTSLSPDILRSIYKSLPFTKKLGHRDYEALSLQQIKKCFIFIRDKQNSECIAGEQRLHEAWSIKLSHLQFAHTVEQHSGKRAVWVHSLCFWVTCWNSELILFDLWVIYDFAQNSTRRLHQLILAGHL